MRTVLVCLLLAGFLAAPAAARPRKGATAHVAKKAGRGKGKADKAPARDFDPATETKRGCCDKHGGVCGCDGGADKCCDGTASSLCSC